MPLSSRHTVPLKGSAEQIAERIRDDIEAGVFAPGEALNQVDLAESFGLSRIPIREALRSLEAEGYVTYFPNKGALVAGTPAAEETLEIIEIRECLELRLMDRAVEHLDAKVLRDAAGALQALNAAKSPAELHGAHERFHTVLFAAAGRPRMASLINAWRFRLDRRPDVDGTQRRAYAAAVAGIHRRLLRACAQRDRKALRRCVTDEYDYIRSIVAKLNRG